MSDRKLAFIYTPEVEQLRYPQDCPFKTQRAGLTRSRLLSLGLLHSSGCVEVQPEKASITQLQEFHTSAYLEELQRAAQGDLTVTGLGMGLGGPDTPVFKDQFEYGAWACGGSLKGADLLLAREVDIAFSLLGGFHHALAEKASGFCYLNDVVLACMRLANAGKRVVYLDIDAHHGDGVQAAFYHRKDVLTISMHESGRTLFPWGGFENEMGEGAGLGYNVNVPLPAGTYDEAFLRAFDRIVLPLLKANAPDCIVLELGLDTLSGDPLTHLQLSNNAIVDVLQSLLALKKPMLVAGGGGYHVENTVRGWALAWRTCCDERDDDAFSLGLGGVMMGSSEWAGGLRDRALFVPPEQRQAVEGELSDTINSVINQIFPHHGLAANGTESGIASAAVDPAASRSTM
jgi:acetoin utilization protein AcuC